MLVKFFISFVVLVASISAQAQTGVDCKATKVHDTSFLEESLSVEEYPDVYVSRLEAMLGSSLLTVQDGHTISFESANDAVEVFIMNPGDEGGYYIILDITTMNGQLYGFYAGDEPEVLIADLVCNE
jgi:hypothetical protein